MTLQPVDVVVVTALKLERRAVRAHLDGFKVEALSGLSADVGPSASRPAQRIAVIETGPGNIAAGLLSLRAEENFRPTFMVMLGVAGGLKDVAIGDVVASSKVYWIEGGKANTMFKPRPDFAPVSGELVQLARAVAADDTWIADGRGDAGSWVDTGRGPAALVNPIVVGEKVVADRSSEAAKLISGNYSDAVAVDMEDFGALRGGTATERAKVIAIRGISDMLAEKTNADEKGSQPLAAANAAGFLFNLLDRLPEPLGKDASSITAESPVNYAGVLAVCRELYPDGPQQDGLWERAGGDRSRLQPDGLGATRWWNAIRTLQNGGGGGSISVGTLINEMRVDYPTNSKLSTLG